MSFVVVAEDKLEKHSTEMLHITMRQQELQRRLSLLQQMQAFLKNKSLAGTVSEEEEQGLSELEKIKIELQLLSERASELVNKKGLMKKESSEYNYTTSYLQKRVRVLPAVQHNVMTGSSEVVVEVKDLSLSPATVHCPACLQQVTTEVRSKIGSTTFFLCFLSMLLGCVGGCCLLPFCVDNFKDVCHTCPSCHSEISTISRI